MDDWEVELPRDQLAKRWAAINRPSQASGRRKPRPHLAPKFTKQEFEAWLIQHSYQRKGQAWECAYQFSGGCEKKHYGISELSFDHIDPIESGGLTTLKNLAICCRTCNNIKGPGRLEDAKQLKALLLNLSVQYRKYVCRQLKQPPGRWVQRGRDADKATKRMPQWPAGVTPVFGQKPKPISEEDF